MRGEGEEDRGRGEKRTYEGSMDNRICRVEEQEEKQYERKAQAEEKFTGIGQKGDARENGIGSVEGRSKKRMK